MRRSLENAATNRGVVVATPTTLKSIMLSYVEVLQHLKEAHAGVAGLKVEELKVQAAELAKILALFKEGIMLLDEVIAMVFSVLFFTLYLSSGGFDSASAKIRAQFSNWG